MVGRIPVIDVTPLVDLGRQPAKATVGEPFPVAATVFREGHDVLGAEVVLTDPDGRRTPSGADDQATPTSPTATTAWVTPDAAAPGPSRSSAWSRPVRHLAAQRRDQDPGRRRRRADVHRGRGCCSSGCSPTLAREADAGGRTVAARRDQGRARDTKRPVAGPAGRARSPPRSPPCSPRHPLRELVTVEGPYPVYVDRARALFSSWYEFFPRSEGATKDAKTGKVDQRHLPAPPPSGSTRSPRWASTSSTCRRSTRSARSTARAPTTPSTPGPDDPGSPWAIGSKDGGHDAIHPDLGTIEDFDAFVARASAARPRGRARPRPAVRARPPVGHRRTRSGSPPAPTARSPTPRTRRRSTRTSTRSTSTTTRAASARRCCGSSGSGWRTACGSSASTTRTPSRWRSGSGCSRGPRDRPRRAVPVRGVHPPGDDARARRGRLPPVLHVLHLAQRQVGDRGVPARALPRDRPPDAAELLRQHARHPARVPPVRRPGGVQDPRRARGDRARRAGASTPASSCSSTSPSSRAARSTSTRRSTRSGSATGTAAEAEGRTLAPYLTRLNEIRRAAPGAAAAAQRRRSTAATTTNDPVLHASRTAADGHRRHRDRRRQRRPARHPRDDRPPRHARARPRLARHVRGRTTRSPARTGAGASTTTCGSTRPTSPPTS